MLLVSLILVVVILATCRWYLNRRGLPPGPPALPLLGSLPFLHLSRGVLDWCGDSRVTRHRLATVSLGPQDVFVINDLKLAKELFDKDEFSGRPIDGWTKLFKTENGAMRGIIFTENSNWTKQRRFGIKTLRDLGFGRRSIEHIINEEITQIFSKLGRSSGQNYLLRSDFNIPFINVLWQLVCGYRFEETESQGRKVIENIDEFFKNYMILATIPISLMKYFRNKFLEENLKIVRNQKQYIVGKYILHLYL